MTTYSSDKAVPYVYICTHKETNQFYSGYREANVKLNRPSHLDLPEYKTSSTTIRPDFPNYTWTIVAEFFDPSHAYIFEQQLICDNWDNPLLLNGYYRLGEHKQFRSSGPAWNKGKPSPLRGRPSPRKGKPSGPQQNPSGRKGMPPWNKGISTGPNGKKGIPSGRKGKPSPLRGRPSPLKGVPGKPRSQESKQKMRKPKGPQKQVICPHCGKDGGITNMKRYHFDNCPKKPVDQIILCEYVTPNLEALF